MPVSFDSQKSYNNYDEGGNISISKKMHTRKIDKENNILETDQLTKSDQIYQETRIPAVDSPDLGLADPYADTSRPSSNPTPQNAFLQKAQGNILNLTSEQLATLGGGISKHEAQAKLLFALNHPGVAVDPNIAKLLNQMTSHAQMFVQKQLDLPASWQPQAPDTASFDKQLTRAMNKNFENLVYSKFPLDQANKLVFEFYHPEFADPSNSSLLSQLKKQNSEEVAQNEGFPEDWHPPASRLDYDAKLGVFYDEAFLEHLNSDPETKDLSPEDKAALETLHHFPDTEVPDKEKLMGLLKQLNQEALKDTQTKFNLPTGFVPETASGDHAAVILGAFSSKFDEAVKNFQPPLSKDQLLRLIATGGIHSKNLSVDLKAIFSQLQRKTANDIAELYGLPKNWLENASAGLETEPEITSEDTENPEETQGSGQTQETDGNISTDPFAAITRKLLKAKSLTASEETSSVQRGNIDHQAALNAIQLYQDGTKVASKWINQLTKEVSGPLGQDWLLAGDFTFVISKALDSLRSNVYKVQMSDAQVSKKSSLMDNDNQVGQNLIQQKKLQEAKENQEKIKPIFAFLESLPGIGWLFKAIDAVIRTQIWIWDVLLGGAISAICKAIGIEPLGQNPLQLVGAITAEQAEVMDFALGVIAMVIQIVIEIILAQPELVMGTIALMTEKASALAADIAIQTAVKAGVEAAVKSGVEAGVKSGVEAAVKVGAEVATEVSAQVGVEVAAKAGVEAGLKAGAKAAEKIAQEVTEEALENIAKNVVEQTGKALSKTEQKILEKAIKKALEENIEKITKVAVEKAQKWIGEGGEEALKNAQKLANEGVEHTDDLLAQGIKKSGSSLDSLKLAGRNFLEAFVENGSHINDVGDLARKVGQKVANKFKGAINKLATNLNEKIGRDFFKTFENHIGKAVESEADVIYGIAKAGREGFVKASTVGKLAASYGTANTTKEFIQGTLQTATGIINGRKELSQANNLLLLAALEDAMTQLQADAKIMKKIQEAILDSLVNLASWINDINKQEGDFYKKSQIHFIAA